ncbi:MAG: hypothetical protein AAF098_04555 [Pseudomonadota bacterium]
MLRFKSRACRQYDPGAALLAPVSASKPPPKLVSRCALVWSTVLLLSFPLVAARAQDAPFVEVSVEPKEVRVGEPVIVQLSLYVPTWFPSPPVFPSLELPNTIIRRPANSSRPSSKTIGRKSWSGISRSYEMFPLIAGSFRLDQQPIAVKYADPGNADVELLLQTKPVSFNAFVPDAAAELTPYLAGTNLEVDRLVENQSAKNAGALTVGDSLTLQYTAEVDGLPALFLPELVPETTVPGLSQYLGLTHVDEQGSIGKRVETVTYIFNAGGTYELPGITLHWLNIETQLVEEASIVPLSITVDGPILGEESVGKESLLEPRWQLTGILLMLLLALSAFPTLLRRVKLRLRRYRQSESCAWRMLNRTLRRGPPHQCYSAILDWYEHIAAEYRVCCMDTGFMTSNSERIEAPRELEKLRKCLYADASSNEFPDRTLLRKELAKVRQRFLRAGSKNPLNSLPALNP